MKPGDCCAARGGGRDKRLQSLNYVTADKADVYQEVTTMNKRHETRAYEVRAAESPLVIEGTAIVFDQPANMHAFLKESPAALLTMSI